MAKKRIIVGREYKVEFESIKKLFGLGVLSPESTVTRVDGNIIETASCVFEYDNCAHGVGGGGASSALCFGKRGATWFEQLRGGEFNSDTAQWVGLISAVSVDYHSQYAMVEFKQTTSDRSSKFEADAERIAKNVAEAFVKKVFGASCVLSDRLGDDYENYYAASLCLSISNGGAEPEPVLCKIYYRKHPTDENRYDPIDKSEAETIDVNINQKINNIGRERDSGEAPEMLTNDPIVENVINNLGKTFSSRDSARYLLCGEKYKKQLFDTLRSKAVSNDKELVCTGIKVLGITHVQWQNYAYKFTRLGKPVLKLVIGFDGSISLYCTNCTRKTTLIENNRVIFDTAEAEKKFSDKFGKMCFVNPELESFGLTKGEFEHITSGNNGAAIASHLFTVSCSVRRRGECSNTICAVSSIPFTEKKNGESTLVRLCADCPYPEIVYEDIFKDLKERKSAVCTRSLEIDEAGCRLTDRKTRTCVRCHRTFAVDGNNEDNGELCPLCGANIDDSESKRLYKKYRRMLPVGTRVKSIFFRKACREDSTVILFTVGNKRYMFNKIEARDRGGINPPKGVK